MKSIKEIWKESWKHLRKGYFLNVLVCYIVGIVLFGGISYYTDVAKESETSKITSIAENSKLAENSKIADSEEVKNDAEAAGEKLDKTKNNYDIISDLIKLQDVIDVKVGSFDDSAEQKYSKGVFSVFVNETTKSGSIILGLLNGLNQLIFKNKIAESVTIFLMVILYALLWIFVGNVLIVGKCRYFLEERIYQKTKADRVLFVYKNSSTMNVSKIMFFRSVKTGLWILTIVGGFIKFYEYRMIPYILAENPNISSKEAFKLSKEMMMGKKWKTFLFDLTLVPAFFISAAAFNFISNFFINPFKDCAYAEIYSGLREEKMATNVGTEYFIDNYIFENDSNAVSYPDEHCPTKSLVSRKWLSTDWDRDYGGNTCILFFFFFSFIGWFWEVIFYLLNEGVFVNRGTLHGPWLPIYGVGGIIIIYFLRPLRKNPPLMFFGTVAACGIVEYSTSFLLEKIMHQKWWDYTGYFMNINGRVCLEGLLVFGIAGVGMTYILGPIVDNLLWKIPPKVRRVLCVVLLCVFVVDVVYSYLHPNVGFGITDGLV